MNIGIAGLGLIGGSLARTIRLHTDHRIWGADTDPAALERARQMDVIDGVLDSEKLRGCSLVLVALYPGAIVEWIREHAGLFAPDCLVIDCGGVKQAVMEDVTPIAAGQRWHFIGGHPMAGREYSGFRYAQDDLFDHASMILTPLPEEQLSVLQRARDFFMDIGFRRVQFTTPGQHDEMIAYTSQLAHVVSSAYVKSPLAPRHKGFSAGSFADMTRVARLNEELWTELFLDNREALLPELEHLIERLGEYRDVLRAGDAEKLRAMLREGREIKEALEEG
ncbi:MAG: prephenate dehydrogenase [Clostridia bacterium]|nr:prephenate dehydrogenase [Clostridia bacterium]